MSSMMILSAFNAYISIDLTFPGTLHRQTKICNVISLMTLLTVKLKVVFCYGNLSQRRLVPEGGFKQRNLTSCLFLLI